MTTSLDLFSDNLYQRYQASIAAPKRLRNQTVSHIMKAIGSPRMGTSGAANAFVVIVGSEFGEPGNISKPVYSPQVMGTDGWDDLWRLRIGEQNPHFDAKWERFRMNTTLWQRLYNWLPDGFGNVELSHSMFAWANLAVTPGGSQKGSRNSYIRGMDEHIAPLILEASARIVVGTNESTRVEIDRWARTNQAESYKLSELNYWCVPVNGKLVLAAKLGHPSRGISRKDFAEGLTLLIKQTERHPNTK